jgi:hypothetical protein
LQKKPKVAKFFAKLTKIIPNSTPEPTKKKEKETLVTFLKKKPKSFEAFASKLTISKSERPATKERNVNMMSFLQK